MSPPPVLTSERIDAMPSGVAEICFAAAQEAGDRLKAAPDMADFERAGRTLQTACRNLHQTIVLKQRFDREQAALAANLRRDAETGRQDAERAHRDAVGRRNNRIRRHFERVLWNEYEDDDAQEMFDGIDERLGELAGDAAFLETPVETLITRLAEEFGVGVEDAADEDEPAGENAHEDDEARAAPVAALPPPPVDAAPEAAPQPEPDPPLRPPDPPPDPPYIPPWENLRPGQTFPGGSGW